MDGRLGQKGSKRMWVLGGLLVVAAGLAVWGVSAAVQRHSGYGDNNADHPDGIAYYCQDCKHGFVITVKALAEHHKAHWGQALPCPKCGSTKTVGGVRCPNCGSIFPRDRLAPQQVCPECKKPIPPPS